MALPPVTLTTFFASVMAAIAGFELNDTSSMFEAYANVPRI